MVKSKNTDKKSAASSGLCDMGCCKVEALITVDGRGQLVLPKDIRKKAGISAGDKLAVVSWEKDGKVCCISLQKADDFADAIKSTLGPLMKDILE